MNLIAFQLHRVLNRLLLDGLRDRRDVLAMQVLAPLSGRYLPWSQASMRPSAIVAVLNDILINRRRQVVECGGGISTFYIARLLRDRGGHLHTIEHDAQWADLLRRALAAEQLSDQVTVVHAPLADTPLSLDGAQWYDEQALQPVRARAPIDLLVVDGPPAYRRDLRHARYPAVPFFKPALGINYTVVLDDINRQGEQEVLARWERELAISFDRRFVDGTISVGRPHRSFTV